MSLFERDLFLLAVDFRRRITILYWWPLLNIEHVCKIPGLSRSPFACSLSKLPLILMVGRKIKKRDGDICRETLDIEFEQD